MKKLFALLIFFVFLALSSSNVLSADGSVRASVNLDQDNTNNVGDIDRVTASATNTFNRNGGIWTGNTVDNTEYTYGPSTGDSSVTYTCDAAECHSLATADIGSQNFWYDSAARSAGYDGNDIWASYGYIFDENFDNRYVDWLDVPTSSVIGTGGGFAVPGAVSIYGGYDEAKALYLGARSDCQSIGGFVDDNSMLVCVDGKVIWKEWGSIQCAGPSGAATIDADGSYSATIVQDCSAGFAASGQNGANLCAGPACAAVCGNNVKEDGEDCDDGNDDPTDGCTNTCTFIGCGDGVLDEDGLDDIPNNEDDEECDPPSPLFGVQTCSPKCKDMAFTFDVNRCRDYSFAELRDYCGEPLAEGLPDNPNVIADADACDNRGINRCVGDRATLAHADKTDPYQITNTQTTSFYVTLEAIAAFNDPTPADILYVLDRSGSMNDPDDNDLLGASRIAKATNALNSIYTYFKVRDDANPGDVFKLGVTSFNHDNTDDQRLARLDNFGATFVSEPAACGCTAIGNAVSGGIEANFNAVLDDLANPLSCQDGSVAKAMVIFSDGIENRIDYLNTVYANGLIPSDITFYTIGIGADSVWETQLRQIATQWGTGNGFYTEITTLDDLLQVYTDIADIYAGYSLAASQATMSITLDDRFSYVSDNSGYPVEQNGQTLVWTLPAQNVGNVERFDITVLPAPGLLPGVYDVIVNPDSQVALANACADDLVFGQVEAEIIELNVCLLEPLCGDFSIDAGEECDDGNLANGDGCNAICEIENCGDGIVHRDLGEQCEPSLYADCGAVGTANECQLNTATSLIDADGTLSFIVEGRYDEHPFRFDESNLTGSFIYSRADNMWTGEQRYRGAALELGGGEPCDQNIFSNELLQCDSVVCQRTYTFENRFINCGANYDLNAEGDFDQVTYDSKEEIWRTGYKTTAFGVVNEESTNEWTPGFSGPEDNPMEGMIDPEFNPLFLNPYSRNNYGLTWSPPGPTFDYYYVQDIAPSQTHNAYLGYGINSGCPVVTTDEETLCVDGKVYWHQNGFVDECLQDMGGFFDGHTSTFSATLVQDCAAGYNHPLCSGSVCANTCGDFNTDEGEQCDDGANGDNADGCTDLCTFTGCGDGVLDEDGLDNFLGTIDDEQCEPSLTAQCDNNCKRTDI